MDEDNIWYFAGVLHCFEHFILVHSHCDMRVYCLPIVYIPPPPPKNYLLVIFNTVASSLHPSKNQGAIWFVTVSYVIWSDIQVCKVHNNCKTQFAKVLDWPPNWHNRPDIGSKSNYFIQNPPPWVRWEQRGYVSHKGRVYEMWTKWVPIVEEEKIAFLCLKIKQTH